MKPQHRYGRPLTEGRHSSEKVKRTNLRFRLGRSRIHTQLGVEELPTGSSPLTF